jgi:FKBP-type peptidyl-prolyl cis-trans isomerase FklB
MKSLIAIAFVAAALLPLSAAEPSSSPLKTQQDKVSYVLGMNLGKQLKKNDVEINYDFYLKGLKDAVSGQNVLLTDEEAQKVMIQFQQELRAKQSAKSKAEGDQNKKAGEAFLEANKKKEGVVTTPSGLQYKVIVKGTGPIPTTNDTVVTHYRGTLINGTEFDNSYKRGEPATFPVTGFIKGWTEALLMMPVGSKWQLFIPSDLAYGERGRPSIPPDSALLFDIELLQIKPKSVATPAPKK